jgi:AcrR family transcriptional regulator
VEVKAGQVLYKNRTPELLHFGTVAVVSPPHRTQEQRRAETQTKVLDATISSLLEVGYAQTTTRHVAALAGVSPGAMAHYYPRRVDLVASAIERLADQRLEAWREAAHTLPDEPGERLPALLDRLWEDFSSPLFTVFVKLWIAAADDPELYERLASAERRIARAVGRLAADSVGELRGQEGWEGRLIVALAAIRGLALMEHFEPRSEPQGDPWLSARAALIDVLEPRQSEKTARRRRAPR